jgi:uncharacterized membrane protein (UPF0136 family)
MATINDLIGRLKASQSDIALALARGSAPTWEAYQRMVGQNQGLQEALDHIDQLLKDDEDE